MHFLAFLCSFFVAISVFLSAIKQEEINGMTTFLVVIVSIPAIYLGSTLLG